MGAVSLFGVELAHPIINASGTWDPLAARRAFGEDAFTRFPFAAHVTKTITVEPRQGNPPPRLWEQPAGLINSIGLPNKGIRRWLAEDLPELQQLPVPLIVNVMGFDRHELSDLVEAVSGETPAIAIELNVSCPNVETGLVIGSDPSECAAAVSAARERTTLPLIVKITPNATDPAGVAVAAVDAGADAVSLVNTLKGLAIAPDGAAPWLGGRTGGVSGPAIRHVALAQTQSVCEGVEVPVIGMGGVSTGRHAADLLAVGATLVAVGSESFRDPLAAERIRLELEGLPVPAM